MNTHTTTPADLSLAIASNLRAHIDAFCEREGALVHDDGRERPCSHAEVARRAGLEMRTLSRLIATGDAKHPPTWPRPEHLLTLAEVLGVSDPIDLLRPPACA